MATATRAVSREKPRYKQLADALRQAILSGELPAGDQFPTENDLCRAHGVSRFTVREALRELQSEGLIARRRGSGTVVRSAALRGGALHQPLSNVGELLQFTRDTQIMFEARGLGPLPRLLANYAGPAGGGEWYGFRGIRTRDDDAQPVATTDAYVIEPLRDAVKSIDLTGDALFTQLSRLGEFRIRQVSQHIQAVSASVEIAALLNIPRRASCLRILRCYSDDTGRLFEISVSHHPGERFAYTMHIDVER